MQIPEKYIFFIKERIKESKMFLNRITISSQKKDNNIKNRINTYKNIVKEENAFINKLKDETSNRIEYAKSEEIQILIRNNGEAVNNEIKGIKKRITNHKEKLSQIKKSIKKKARFIKITKAGFYESMVHSVEITKEGPNYKL